MSVNVWVSDLVRRIVATDAVWATAHDAASGTAYDDSPSVQVYANNSGGAYDIARGFLPVYLTIDPATFDAELWFWGFILIGGDPTELYLVEATPADPEAIADGDFDQIGSVALSDSVTVSDEQYTNGWLKFTLNAAGKALLAFEEWTTFAIITAADFNDTAPVGTTALADISAGAGATHPPFLRIVTEPVPPSGVAATPLALGVNRLTWTKSPGAVGYRIYSGGTANPTRLLGTVGDVATFDDTVMPGTYHYRIVAIGLTGWDDSGYSTSVSCTNATTPAFALNFGNGVVAGGKSTDGVRVIDFDGLDAPEVELAILENGVLDGGRFSTSRAASRRITVKIEFAEGTTRYEAAQKFTPGVLRTLTSPRGSIGYYVAVPPAFSTSVLTGRLVCSLSLHAAAAYPAGIEEVETLATGTGTFPSRSDVSCFPSLSITVPAGGGSLIAITTSAGITYLNGTFLADDVVVIDSGVPRVITQDGVNALSTFDKATPWPALSAGDNTVTVTVDDVAAATVVTWRPLVMGLVV